LQARPPAKQGEAAWGTSGQVTIGMMEQWNTGPGEIEKSFTPVRSAGLTPVPSAGTTGRAGQAG